MTSLQSNFTMYMITVIRMIRISQNTNFLGNRLATSNEIRLGYFSSFANAKEI